jgi:hypothetical protein
LSKGGNISPPFGPLRQRLRGEKREVVCLREAASAKAGANLFPYQRFRFVSLPEFTLGEIPRFP